MDEQSQFSRRERQIMDAVFATGEASVNEVLERMDDPPSRTAVRTILRILVDKGHLTTKKVGRELIYRPTSARKQVGKSALNRVLDTFYDGSLVKAVASQLTGSQGELSDEELKELASLIRDARKAGR